MLSGAGASARTGQSRAVFPRRLLARLYSHCRGAYPHCGGVCRRGGWEETEKMDGKCPLEGAPALLRRAASAGSLSQRRLCTSGADALRLVCTAASRSGVQRGPGRLAQSSEGLESEGMAPRLPPAASPGLGARLRAPDSPARGSPLTSATTEVWEGGRRGHSCPRAECHPVRDRLSLAPGRGGSQRVFGLKLGGEQGLHWRLGGGRRRLRG